jgi:type VI secretion system ImpA family protein
VLISCAEDALIAIMSLRHGSSRIMAVRESYLINEILGEIPGTTNGVGSDMSLAEVYDRIKEARFDEDDRLSLGVWERDLKKADWPLVEKLSFNALKEKTKDMQILGWFIESLVVLDKFSGTLEGIKILHGFIDLFWYSSYPHDENNTSDTSQKFRILDWIYDTIGRQSLFMQFPLSNELYKINLYNYEYAVELKNASLKSSNGSEEIIENAKRSNIKTIEEIRNIVDSWGADGVSKTISVINEIRDAKIRLESMIYKVSKDNNGRVLARLMSNFDKIERIMVGTKKRIATDNEEPRTDNEEPRIDIETAKCNRDEIYDNIERLAKDLKAIERHSPSSYILEVVVSWRDRELLEIIDDLKSGNSEGHKLLRFLMS